MESVSLAIEREVPRDGKANVGIAGVVPIVVDIETFRVEVANVDVIAVGVKMLPVSVLNH